MIFSEGNLVLDPYKAVIDSGCPKSVTGRPWLDAFIESNDCSHLVIRRRRENEKFKFGPSCIYSSFENYEIPVSIGNLKETIVVSVVDADIPLLIGLDYQRKWGVVMDIGRSNIYIRKSNENFPMKTSMKHWTLPIQSSNILQRTKNLVFHVSFETFDIPKLRKHIVKVHKNLCHKSEEQMLRIFKLAGKDTPDIRKLIKEVVDTCNICKRFRKTPPRPKVAMC